MVLLRNSQRDGRKGGKLQKRWLGPYKVVDSIGKGRYILFNPMTRAKLRRTVNINRLKLYHSSILHISKKRKRVKCSSAVLQESGNYEDASPEKEQDGASKKGAHELSLSKKTRVMECTTEESGDCADPSLDNGKDSAAMKGAHKPSLSKKTRVMECTTEESGDWADPSLDNGKDCAAKKGAHKLSLSKKVINVQSQSSNTVGNKSVLKQIKNLKGTIEVSGYSQDNSTHLNTADLGFFTEGNKQDSYLMHFSNDNVFSNTLCPEDGFTTSTPKQCGGYFVPMNAMDTSPISCVEISGLTHHTVLAYKSVPLEPEACSTEKKTTRCLKTRAAMRDSLKRKNAQQSSAAGNNLITHPGNVMLFMCYVILFIVKHEYNSMNVTN
jgi:hypothetical protein